MKKIILIAVSVVLVLSLLVACAGPGGDTAAPAQADQAAAAPAPAAEPPADGNGYFFTIYRHGAWPTFPADGGEGKEIMKYYMRNFGLPYIDWEVVAIGGAEFFDILNLRAASDSLPDVFNLNMVTLRSFADQGLIIPLEDRIHQLPALVDYMRPADLDALHYNGHLFAIPVGFMPDPINSPDVNGLLIRQDWLDNLGLEVPRTIDEMEEVMIAFRDGDPNGDGSVVFGYIGDSQTLFMDVFGAFGIQPTFWMETPDGLRMGSTLPATKYALEVLQRWFAEGLIDPDIFAIDGLMREQRFANSMGGIFEGSGFTGATTNPDHAALLSAHPYARLTGLAPIIGPDGHSGRMENSPGFGNIRGISSRTEDLDVLFQLLNWTVDQSEWGGHLLCSVGEPGVDVIISDCNMVITQLNDFDTVNGRGLGNPVRFLQLVDRRWMDEEARAVFHVFYGGYRQNAFWQTTPSMLDFPDTVEILFRQYLANIVMGNLPVEAWYDYVAEFYAMGGDRIEQEVNEAFNARR